MDNPAACGQVEILRPLAVTQHHPNFIEHRQRAFDTVGQQAATIGQDRTALVGAEA